MFLHLSIVFASLVFANAGWQENEAVVVLETYVNSFSNDVMYERVIGRPQINISKNSSGLTVNIKDAVLASSLCIKQFVETYYTFSEMDANCPVDDGARPMTKCSATVAWKNGAPNPKIESVDCGSPY